MKIIKSKTTPIAWFVSNCYATSKRERLVNDINKTTLIDVYGKCGKLQCPANAAKCEALLESKYYFYLSFENALCQDYVTEKLYRPLSRFVIPIVYNGADSSLFAPPKSFINANDFKDVEELTKYLKFLMENPREYIKYFWWKKHYATKSHPTFPYMLCDLCKKLNDENFMQKNHQYEDIEKWWSENKCTEPKIKFNME
jgi:alpha-1,3-fucosyltransferase